MRRTTTIMTALAATLALAGCGGGGDEGADAPEASGDGATPTSAEVATDAPEGCTGPWTFDLRAANAFAELPVVEEPAFELTSSLAVRLAPGAYTLYLADFEIDPETFSDFETDHPPAGAWLATITINAFQTGATLGTELPELEVGDIVPAGNLGSGAEGERTLGVVLEQGLEGGDEPSAYYNTSSSPEGQAEVLAMDGESICLAIEYVDYEGASTTNGVPDEYPVQKRLVGTFSAPIVDF